MLQFMGFHLYHGLNQMINTIEMSVMLLVVLLKMIIIQQENQDPQNVFQRQHRINRVVF